ncbi:L-type lectin-domain containing receptor kinase IV.1-like [Iris pallida]|uniref:non-specific serine/threonine protein kinase n=1 Tax=Iris pallida TaxID=29817 RepID=A0AAX6GHC3_IRIPA|nr:L-type lectin-domain containing receptor kinase IV.1-like [Iris pallida]
MATKILLFLFLLVASSAEDTFIFNGFRGANVRLDGAAYVNSDGLLLVTDAVRQTMGHAFFPAPLQFRSPRGGGGGGGKILSFSSTFVFAMGSQYTGVNGCGLAFVVSGTNNLSAALPNQYIGLFNKGNNGNSSDRILAVELDTVLNPEFGDIDGNHVGIDLNSLTSVRARTAGYYDGTTDQFKNLSLVSGQPMQVWVDYGGDDMILNVTMSPVGTPKPNQTLVSSAVDLSNVVSDSMYVGFASGTGSFFTTHCVLGWSFRMNGAAPALDYTKLPPVPQFKTGGRSRKLAIWLTVASTLFVLLVASVVVFFVRRRIKYAELLEDWEREYGPHRFSYKDLFKATNGFKDKDLLGIGGFGRVYRGVLPTSKIEVAVKRVSHDSKQGMKEFVAEIVSIGQLRHRNVVQLLGYCRRKGELLLVYDYMPNASLDKFLHERGKPVLTWDQRFRIIKGVASGLLYLHEDWEQVVVHRDIKASNVLLDSEMNGRLGDFGLARLYEHGSVPQTTHVVGTMGYIAPELGRTGKATTATDVFAYGAFLLEVACGRRPIETKSEQMVLVDWVLENWKKGSVLATCDRRLRGEFPVAEMELVLKLGLLCSHPMPAARPGMRQVMQFLDGDAAFPELTPAYLNFSILSLLENQGFDDYVMSFPSTVATMSAVSGAI